MKHHWIWSLSLQGQNMVVAENFGLETRRVWGDFSQTIFLILRCTVVTCFREWFKLKIYCELCCDVYIQIGVLVRSQSVGSKWIYFEKLNHVFCISYSILFVTGSGLVFLCCLNLLWVQCWCCCVERIMIFFGLNYFSLLDYSLACISLVAVHLAPSASSGSASLRGANWRLGSSRGDTLHQALQLLSTPPMLPLLSC